MTNVRHFRSLLSDLSFGAATAMLAVVSVLAVIVTQPLQGQTYKVIYTFTGGVDGANPHAGLTLDNAGNLYGTAAGGDTGNGTVFELKPKGSSWLFNRLYSFAGGSDGADPEARVIFGPNGTLYGATAFGGTGSCSLFGSGCGTVFNMRPAATVCKTVLCP
jgi:uncharacterized repeat protein (TIGR03803 family)